MTLPDLHAWHQTRYALHMASHIVAEVRGKLVPPQPNYLHFAMEHSEKGLTTGDQPLFGELWLSLAEQVIVFNKQDRFELAGYSQAHLAQAVQAVLDRAETGVSLPQERLADETVLMPDPATAQAYDYTLGVMVSALRAVRAELIGPTTPVVVWPHGFDASFLWFATENATEEHPHMNFGFSPYSEGFERPYLYFYAYPSPPNLFELALPGPGYWHSAGWNGAVFPYDELIGLADPVGSIAEMLLQVQQQAARLL